MSTVYIRFSVCGLAALQRSPLLEKLLARASQPVPIADWREDAFRTIERAAPMPAVAAAALHAARPTAAACWACVATPIQVSAGMSSVTMPPDGILELRADEADELARDFNRVFEDARMQMVVGRAAVLLCVFGCRLEVVTRDPEALAGQDVFGFQPVGTDGPRLRRLMSEIEMWLFEHPVNQARVARAERPITGLWLWGGGQVCATLPTFHAWTAGQDPFFSAFGAEPQFPRAGGAGVAVCARQPGSPEWAEVERGWLVPAAAALRGGLLERLELSAADRRFSVTKGTQLRFWRRPRPWWESYGIQ